MVSSNTKFQKGFSFYWQTCVELGNVAKVQARLNCPSFYGFSYLSRHWAGMCGRLRPSLVSAHRSAVFGQDSVKPTWPHFLLDLSTKALANLHVAHSSWDHTLNLPRWLYGFPFYLKHSFSAFSMSAPPPLSCIHRTVTPTALEMFMPLSY